MASHKLLNDDIISETMKFISSAHFLSKSFQNCSFVFAFEIVYNIDSASNVMIRSPRLSFEYIITL